MAEQLKNIFSRELVKIIANLIKKYEESFSLEAYLDKVFLSLSKLELKDRIRLISSSIKKYLPLNYEESINVLIKVKKDFIIEENWELTSMIFPDFVEVYGLDDFDISLNALEIFTINSSSEFAIRQFLIKDEERSLKYFYKWAKSSNEHIKRLASEGCRPRLPWAIALPSFKKDPSLIMPILKLLKNDESLYVRRSVANNLNDISKDNEKFVIDFVRENIGKNKNLDWLCKHASRTLLKKGNKEILKLFSYGDCSHIKVENFIFTKFLKIGEILEFSFLLNSKKALGNIRLEYAISYKKANSSYSKKMFMISQNFVKENEKKFNKKQSFRNMTIRKHYKGEHFLHIYINGKEKEKRSFILNDTSN